MATRAKIKKAKSAKSKSKKAKPTKAKLAKAKVAKAVKTKVKPMADIIFRTSEGGRRTIAASAIEALSAGLRGKVVHQSASNYDEARTIWNAMIDRRPGLIVRCVGAADVVSAVDFARDNESARRGAWRRPQHRRQRGLRWRPDDRSVADEIGAGRSGDAAGLGRARRDACRSSTRRPRPSAWRCRPASIRPPASPA